MKGNPQFLKYFFLDLICLFSLIYDVETARLQTLYDFLKSGRPAYLLNIIFLKSGRVTIFKIPY